MWKEEEVKMDKNLYVKNLNVVVEETTRKPFASAEIAKEYNERLNLKKEKQGNK